MGCLKFWSSLSALLFSAFLGPILLHLLSLHRCWFPSKDFAPKLYLRTIMGIPLLWPWTLNSLIFCNQLDLGKWSHKQDVRERARRKEKSGYLLPHSLLLCYGSGPHCASLRLQLQLCGCPSMISLPISSDTLPLPFLVSLRASILVRKDEFAAVKNLLPNLSDLQLQWLIIGCGAASWCSLWDSGDGEAQTGFKSFFPSVSWHFSSYFIGSDR